MEAAVPIMTMIVLMLAGTHWDVWSADPNSYDLDGIFIALPAAGIVFSYLGFLTAIARRFLYLQDWIIYWTGFKTDSFLFGLVAVGFVIYAIYYHAIARKPGAEFGWRSIPRSLRRPKPLNSG
jgi:hypothetical protein